MTTDAKANARFIFGLAVALVMFCTALFVYMNTSRNENNDDAELCILFHLSEHRVNTYDADRDEAAAEGRPFNVPRGAPQVQEKLASACERVLGK
jgi:hypothetical protein